MNAVQQCHGGLRQMRGYKLRGSHAHGRLGLGAMAVEIRFMVASVDLYRAIRLFLQMDEKLYSKLVLRRFVAQVAVAIKLSRRHQTAAARARKYRASFSICITPGFSTSLYTIFFSVVRATPDSSAIAGHCPLWACSSSRTY